MVDPKVFGYGTSLTLAAGSQALQRRLRKMSTDPAEPRIFSQALVWVPLGGTASFLMAVCTIALVDAYFDGTKPLSDVVACSLMLILSLFFLSYGLFRRWGVDQEKVWTKFWPFFYREVRFDQITRFNIGVYRYKLYVGRKLVNIDYNRFDYALVYIRLLEELQYRKFQLEKVMPNDPTWENEAQAWRNVLGADLYNDHQAFYDSHPDALASLNYLVQPPTHHNHTHLPPHRPLYT